MAFCFIVLSYGMFLIFALFPLPTNNSTDGLKDTKKMLCIEMP